MVTINTSILQWSAASAAMPGESISGDRCLVKEFPGGVLTAVVDGLGHGREAAEAAFRAIQTMEQSPSDSLVMLVNRCHESLRRTRGVVMSLASFSAADQTMTWLGVGNVRGILLRADPKKAPTYETLFLNHGVVGGNPPSVSAFILRVSLGDTLILATDGIAGGIEYKLTPCEPPQQIAKRILSQSRLGTDDALVLVARYTGSA